MKRIGIWSSNGNFAIDEHGDILDRVLYVGGELPPITRFDVEEYRATYGKLDESIDILDIGYWYGPNDTYEPADPDFRKQVRDYDTMNADGSVEKDDTHWNVMR